MAKKVIEGILKRIEETRKIKLPQCLLDNENVKKLENLVNLKNPIVLSNYYKNLEGLNENSLNYVEDILKEERDISEEDKKLIKNIIKLGNSDPNLFFDYIGNLFYISELTDELNKVKENLPIVIKISVSLWIYVNMIEMFTNIITNLIKDYLTVNNLDNNHTEFIKSFKNGEHPTINNMITTMKKLSLIEEPKNSIFENGRVLRNYISHANIYYDKNRNSIIVPLGKEYSMDEFGEDFDKLYSFIKEFAYQYNGNSTNLSKTMNSKLKILSKAFQKIDRAGNIKKEFNKFVIEW